jgi:hypothetical protein
MEAERFCRILPKRLVKFGLEVAPEKTFIHRFSRFPGPLGDCKKEGFLVRAWAKTFFLVKGI